MFYLNSLLIMKNKRTNIAIVLLLLTSFCCFSCKDAEIAKEMEGTWTTSYVESFEDGTKSYIDEQITFINDNPETDGGSFVEIRTGNEELDEDEVHAKYRWASRIEGTWEINIEDLVLHYNISTLEVEIGKDDVDLDISGEAWIKYDWGSLLMGGLYLNANLYKELKKEVYKNLFRHYKEINDNSNNDGNVFPNVQIKGSILSFETSDMGRIEFSRIEDEVNKVDKTNKYSYNFIGSIDKYNITMYFNIDDNDKVHGYYYYDSQGAEKKIDLSGRIIKMNDSSQLILNCDNHDVFDGYLDENTYSGVFSNSRGSELSFNMNMIK